MNPEDALLSVLTRIAEALEGLEDHANEIVTIITELEEPPAANDAAHKHVAIDDMQE